MDIDRRMFLSANGKLELEWWISNVMTAKNVMSRGQPSWSSRQMLLMKVGGLCSEHSPQVAFGLRTKSVFLGLKAFFDSHRNSHTR